MLCLLPHFLPVLLPQQLAGVPQTLPFLAGISHLILSCLAIGHVSFIYQRMRAMHIHSLHSTAEGREANHRSRPRWELATEMWRVLESSRMFLRVIIKAICLTCELPGFPELQQPLI